MRLNRTGRTALEGKPLPPALTTGDLTIEAADSEAGTVVSFQCPRCAETIRWAASKWWDTRCSCGYRWRVEMEAVGELSE